MQQSNPLDHAAHGETDPDRLVCDERFAPGADNCLYYPDKAELPGSAEDLMRWEDDGGFVVAA